MRTSFWSICVMLHVDMVKDLRLLYAEADRAAVSQGAGDS